MTIEPDTKNWTWVLERPCPECGFDAAEVLPTRVVDVVRDAPVRWRGVLARPEARTRPDPSTWSPTEYGCHVRDVLDRFRARLEQMLTEDDPTVENWDQDVAAIEGHYDRQEPAIVADQLTVAADRMVALLVSIDDGWERPGRRSDGAVFTVGSFAVYFAHDLVHHLYDVGG